MLASFFHLLLRQVDEQVGDDEHGVGRIFAHRDGHDGPVGLGNDAVDGQRERDPLVLLDAAVVVRVEKREVGGLVQRVLLEVEARRVDVRAQDVEAMLERLGAQVHEDEGLAVRVRPDLVARLEMTAVLDEFVERDIAGVFGLLDGGSGDLALDLVIGDEVDIACGKLVYLGELVA